VELQLEAVIKGDPESGIVVAAPFICSPTDADYTLAE
jgi:hypothetical protein